MNCREFEAIAVALARGEELEEPARRQGLAHADCCPGCGGRLAAQRRLTATFAAAAGQARG
jgi:hypothetical protein